MQMSVLGRLDPWLLHIWSRIGTVINPAKQM